jgi:hypothetical protein
MRFDPSTDDPEWRPSARQIRKMREEAGRMRRNQGLKKGGRWTKPCVKCGEVGPAKLFGPVRRRIRVCKACWAALPQKVKKEINASHSA